MILRLPTTRAMTVSSEASTKGKTTQGWIKFTKKKLTDGGTIPWAKTEVHEDGSRSRTMNIELESKQIEVHDIRTADKSFSLQKEGFIQQQLQVPKTLDWQDDEQVSSSFHCDIICRPASTSFPGKSF